MVAAVIGWVSKLFTFFFLFGLVVQSIVEGQEITLWAEVGYHIVLAACDRVGDIGEIRR